MEILGAGYKTVTFCKLFNSLTLYLFVNSNSDKLMEESKLNLNVIVIPTDPATDLAWAMVWQFMLHFLTFVYQMKLFFIFG